MEDCNVVNEVPSYYQFIPYDYFPDNETIRFDFENLCNNTHSKSNDSCCTTIDKEHKLNLFLNEINGRFPDLIRIAINNTNKNNTHLMHTILKYFLIDNYNKNNDNDNNRRNRIQKEFALINCDLSSFFNSECFKSLTKYDNNDDNSGKCTIYISKSSILNTGTCTNNNDSIHNAIEKCSYFNSWQIECCNNNDILFVVNALSHNIHIKYLYLFFGRVYQQFKKEQGEIDIFIESIMSVLYNYNKSLLELEFNFDNVHFNSYATNAETTTTNNQTEESIIQKEIEMKFLHTLLNGKLNVKKLIFTTGAISLHFLESLIRCAKLYRKSLQVCCGSEEGNRIFDQDKLSIILDGIGSTCYSTNLQVDEIVIYKITGNLLRFIVLYFVQHKYWKPTLTLHDQCELLEFLQVDKFNDPLYYENNDNNNNNNINTSSNQTIYLPKTSLYIKNKTNIHTFGTAIENFSMLLSWQIDTSHHVEDTVFVLNALAKNKYIQNLKIKVSFYNEAVHSIIIAAITNIVTHSTSLLSFQLDLGCNHLTYTSTWDDLAEALVNSKNINDICFQRFSFFDEKSLQTIHSVFQRKTNICKLKLDSSLFSWYEQFEVDEVENYKEHFFNANVFNNLFMTNKKNNHCFLRELDVRFEFTGPESKQEILLFFTLLKESYVEKLTININYEEDNHVDKEYLQKTLFLNNIPFMSRLCYIDITFCFFWGLHSSFVEMVRTCSRTLMKVDKVEFDCDDMKNELMIQKYLKRNCGLTACIKNKTNFLKYAYPIVFAMSVPTGPDATFHLLCNMGLSVGPMNYKATTGNRKRKGTS